MRVVTVNAAVAIVVCAIRAGCVTTLVRRTERLGGVGRAAYALTAPVITVGVAIGVIVFAVGTELSTIFSCLLAAYRYVLISRAIKVATVDVAITIVVNAIGARCIVVLWIAFTADSDIFIARTSKVFAVDVAIAVVVDPVRAGFIVVFRVTWSTNGYIRIT